MLGERDRRNMRGTLRQAFVLENKTCGMCIEDLNIAKALGNMHIRTFFISLARQLNTKTQQRYIDIFCSESVVPESLSFWSKYIY